MNNKIHIYDTGKLVLALELKLKPSMRMIDNLVMTLESILKALQIEDYDEDVFDLGISELEWSNDRYKITIDELVEDEDQLREEFVFQKNDTRLVSCRFYFSVFGDLTLEQAKPP